MKLNSGQLGSLAEIAIAAARAAGRHIAETRPREIRRDKTGDNLASQVLTEVDGQCQEMTLELLAPACVEFDLAILAEESEDDGSRLEKDHFWCIDPIDGTLPYIEGVPGYAVSIALVSRAGEPLIGVAYDPVEHTLYHAVKGAGAYRNEKPWCLPAADDQIQIITDRSVADDPYCGRVAAALGASVKGQGGAVMNALWCLENPRACYFKFPKEEQGGGCFWDYATTAVIYNEIGAVATDMSGEPLNFNAASIYMNAGGVLFATDAALAERLLKLNKELT